MTAGDLSPEREERLIGEMLRERGGIDPGRLGPVIDLAALGLVNGAWRNTCVEDWDGDFILSLLQSRAGRIWFLAIGAGHGAALMLSLCQRAPTSPDCCVAGEAWSCGPPG